MDCLNRYGYAGSLLGFSNGAELLVSVLYRVFATAITFTGLLVCSTAMATPLDEAGGLPAGYRLVWADEFETPGLPDPTAWDYDTYRNRVGWWGKELQYYAGKRVENSRVQDGLLVIEARREDLDRSVFPDSGGQRYTSARLITRGLRSWTYGFFEVRARLPCGLGSWPAIWMLSAPTGMREPVTGEIDIMEQFGFQPGVILGSIHTWALVDSMNTHQTERTHVAHTCGEFHRYQLTWTKSAIVIGVDDHNYARWQKTSATDTFSWPFDRPQYLILNIAVGGEWNGGGKVNDKIFPVRMEIDYVRVYQGSQEGTQ